MYRMTFVDFVWFFLCVFSIRFLRVLCLFSTAPSTFNSIKANAESAMNGEGKKHRGPSERIKTTIPLKIVLWLSGERRISSCNSLGIFFPGCSKQAAT